VLSAIEWPSTLGMFRPPLVGPGRGAHCLGLTSFVSADEACHIPIGRATPYAPRNPSRTDTEAVCDSNDRLLVEALSHGAVDKGRA
jgi:hypothetical protein